jgi:hypothetical protein
MSDSIVSQLRAALKKASQMMKEARKRGDAETYQSLQVQWEALRGQLERAKRGEYATLESASGRG